MKRMFVILTFGWLLSATSIEAATVQTAAVLAATHGYVYVNLPKNAGATAEIKLQSVGEKKKYTLLTRQDPGIDAYGLWLPEGDYVMASWGDTKWADYPSIHIAAGKITSLGSFVPISVGGYDSVVLPLQLPETAGHVQDAISQFQTWLTSPEVIEWRPQVPPQWIGSSIPYDYRLGLIASLLVDYSRHVNKPPVNAQLRNAKSIDEFLALAKTAAPPLVDQPASDDKSNLYFGADFGQVRVRSSEGAWSAVDTGTLERISAVAWFENLLLAGTDKGVLRSSADGGVHWQKVAALDPGESVIGISRSGPRWIIATVHPVDLRGIPSADRLAIYSVAQGDFNDLKNLKQERIDPGSAAGIWQPAARIEAGFYYINALPGLLRLNLETLEWKSIAPPTPADAFNIAAPSGVITAVHIKGMFSKVFVSSDRGDSWAKRDAPPYLIQDVYFDSEKSGRAARIKSGAFTGNFELLDYESGTGHWKNAGEAPHGCVRLLHDPAHQQTFCVTNGGSILASAGNEWKVEFAAE